MGLVELFRWAKWTRGPSKIFAYTCSCYQLLEATATGYDTRYSIFTDFMHIFMSNSVAKSTIFPGEMNIVINTGRHKGFNKLVTFWLCNILPVVMVCQREKVKWLCLSHCHELLKS